MNMARALKNYVLENEFQVHILKGRINIVNYTSIGHFDENKVIVRHNEGSVHIKGEHLVVSRLLHDEILITGKVGSIQFES
ncbi:MAG: YabP/YqfC family sporulation protein [Bacilli bacterium]|nr:YabP/YqfC family sporulation protein [Bacilli bacterium]